MPTLLQESPLVKSGNPSSGNLSIEEGSAAYAQLRAQITAEGILKRSYSYYLLLISAALAGFFLSAFLIVATPLSLPLAAWVVLFSLATVQIAGLLHDAGHRTIFATARMNDIAGHVMGSILAMPFHAWRGEHNQHHARPNQEDEDPDINLPFMSLSRERYLARTGFSKLIAPYQMYLWYPVSWLYSLYKRLDGIRYFRQTLRRDTAWQLVLYVLGLCFWFVLPFVLFDMTKAVFVIIFHSMLSGAYLANVFAPNHKGMPFLPKDVKISFIEQQILTARNVRPGTLTDFVYLGLNYQIEHHLFPTCPRNKLKLLTPHVKRVCRELDLPFTVVSVIESNKLIFLELKSIASPAAAAGAN